MARWPKPVEGSWTEHYPELGTGLVSYEDSISPEIYELEREAIFKRAWLNVGRVEQLPGNGRYFTKEIEAANASIVVVQDNHGQIRAFHNVCRHRGNKLVWKDFPREETSGVAASSPASTTGGATDSMARARSCSRSVSSSSSTRPTTGSSRYIATSSPASSS